MDVIQLTCSDGYAFASGLQVMTAECLHDKSWEEVDSCEREDFFTRFSETVS